MSAEGEPEGAAKPQRPSFRARNRAPKLADDKAKRQGEITHFAFSSLGDRDTAMTFLNTFNESLGGRPLDVAMADQDGLDNVMSAIRLLTMPGRGTRQ